MEVKDALRRIKRNFGDEYNVVIFDQDIYDWIYDAELDIIRATSANEKTIQISASAFPVSVPDSVNLKRLSINGRALTYTSVPELDLNRASLETQAGLYFWYRSNGLLNLFPAAELSDDSIIDVTYMKTPTPMTNAEPFLNYEAVSQVFQYASIGSNPDWRLNPNVCVEVDLSLSDLTKNVILVSANGGPATSDFHFQLTYVGTAYPTYTQFQLQVGNGTTLNASNLNFLQKVTIDERFKLRFSFQSDLNKYILYRVDEDGLAVQQAVDDRAGTFSKLTTGQANLYLGSFDGNTVPPASPFMKIYGVRLYVDPAATVIGMVFDAEADLANIPIISGQINLTTTSGHVMTTHGHIVDAPDNQFTVPEVYHEDIVKYCLARAHAKNQNFKASESEMEQYDRRVSTRRNEAQAPEIALYKVHDPFDYDYASTTDGFF